MDFCWFRERINGIIKEGYTNKFCEDITSSLENPTSALQHITDNVYPYIIILEACIRNKVLHSSKDILFEVQGERIN